MDNLSFLLTSVTVVILLFLACIAADGVNRNIDEG